MAETFHTQRYYIGSKVKVQYAEVTGQWNVMGKNVDSYGNALVTSTYGTKRANAYRLLEDALNLRDTKIYDTVQDLSLIHISNIAIFVLALAVSAGCLGTVVTVKRKRK